MAAVERPYNPPQIWLETCVCTSIADYPYQNSHTAPINAGSIVNMSTEKYICPFLWSEKRLMGSYANIGK